MFLETFVFSDMFNAHRSFRFATVVIMVILLKVYALKMFYPIVVQYVLKHVLSYVFTDLMGTTIKLSYAGNFPWIASDYVSQHFLASSI